MFIQIILFIVSCIVLSLLSKSLVKTLIQIAKYLNWREFIVGFFVMAFATSLPNLFVDVNAALRGLQSMAFGDVVGGNLVDLTLVMALAVLFSKNKTGISAKSSMVQKSAIFTAVIAVLPLLLIFDGYLGRGDGIILLLAFFIYAFWIFSKEDNFQKVYSNAPSKKLLSPLWLLANVGKLIVLLALLVGSSFVIISAAQFFAGALGTSLAMIGVLIVGLGNCFPETYFSIVSAKKGEGWLVLGDLMGSVIVCATLVLGIVALIAPFAITDFSPFLVARIFTIIAVLLYIFAIKTDRKITKKEGALLLAIYIFFLLTEVFLPR